MKALTICQPFAHLIAIGEKRVENRTWPTSYRGPLAIHAGLSRAWLGRADFDADELVFGAVVAVAEVVACWPLHQIKAGDVPEESRWLARHDHTEGPWCWVLDEIMPLQAPIPARGNRRLWTWTPPGPLFGGNAGIFRNLFRNL